MSTLIKIVSDALKLQFSSNNQEEVDQQEQIQQKINNEFLDVDCIPKLDILCEYIKKLVSNFLEIKQKQELKQIHNILNSSQFDLEGNLEDYQIMNQKNHKKSLPPNFQHIKNDIFEFNTNNRKYQISQSQRAPSFKNSDRNQKENIEEEVKQENEQIKEVYTKSKDSELVDFLKQDFDTDEEEIHNQLITDQYYDSSHQDNKIDDQNDHKKYNRKSYQKKKNIRQTYRAKKWVPNDMYLECKLCKAYFNLVRRRHHCRKCGNLICGSCSNHEEYVRGYGDQKVRVCDGCYKEIWKFKKANARKWSIISSYHFTSNNNNFYY